MKKQLLGALCVLSFAAGCGEEKLKAGDIAKAASTNTAAIIRGTGGASQVVNQLSAVSTVIGGLNSVGDSFASVPLDNDAPDAGGISGGSSGSSEDYEAPAAPPEQSFNEQADRVQKYLEERIFTEENLEESDATSGVFKLTGEDVCTDGTTPADPNCVTQIDKLDLRIRAVLGAPNGVDLTFLIGPNKFEPVTLLIREDSLAIQFNLAQIKSTVEFVAQQNNETVNLPRKMEGIYELKLQKNGEKDITFSSTVVQAISVEVDGTNGVFAFSTAQTAPNALHSLRLEGPAKKATFKLDLGQTTVALPYKDVNASGTAGNRVTYSLGGMSYDFSAQEGQTAFTVAHVGLGNASTTWSIDGQELYKLDLNQLSNRHFDITIEKDTDELPIVKVSPEFDLVQKFALGLLSADQYVAPHLVNETYRVRLTGGAQQSVKPVSKNDAGFPGGLKVVAGTLTLETDKAGVSPITVPAGSCLTEKTFEDGGHPLFGHLTVQACP